MGVDSLTAMVNTLQNAIGFSAQPAEIIADVQGRAQAALESAQLALNNSVVYVGYLNMTVLEMKANVLQLVNTTITEASESTQADIDVLTEQTLQLVDQTKQMLMGQMDLDKAKADLEKSGASAPGVCTLAIGTIVLLCSWL